MTRATGALALVAAILLVAAGSAAAEHRVYYRYVVLGYAKDARGRPLAGVPVKVVRDRTTFSYVGETDREGLYVIVTRLGDESVGETLTVSIGKSTARVRVRFDPSNHSDERGTRVDLEGARVVERPAAFRPTLARVLAEVSR